MGGSRWGASLALVVAGVSTVSLASHGLWWGAVITGIIAAASLYLLRRIQVRESAGAAEEIDESSEIDGEDEAGDGTT